MRNVYMTRPVIYFFFFRKDFYPGAGANPK